MASAFSSTGSENMSKLASEICSLIACDVSCNHNHKRHSSTPFIDWFRLLGVEEDADGDAIRKRYHSLALLLHPDKNKDHQAETAFKLVLELVIKPLLRRPTKPLAYSSLMPQLLAFIEACKLQSRITLHHMEWQVTLWNAGRKPIVIVVSPAQTLKSFSQSHFSL